MRSHKDRSTFISKGLNFLKPFLLGFLVFWIISAALHAHGATGTFDLVRIRAGTLPAACSQGSIFNNTSTGALTYCNPANTFLDLTAITTFSGTLTVGHGGTGDTTLTNHGVLIGQAASAVAVTAAGSAGQLLASGGGSADPAWTTPTYPITSQSAGKVLISDGTNFVGSTPKFPNASATSGKFIRSDGTDWIASTPTLPTTAGSSGKILISDGTNWVSSTPTYPNSSATTGKILISDGTNFIASTPTYPNSSATTGKILISDGTNFIASTPTYPNTSATSGKILVSDGTNFIASTPTYPNSSATSGKILVSDGTNFVASTPTYPNASATSGKFIISDGTNFISSTPTIPNTAGTAGKVLISDGTNYVSSTPTYPNASPGAGTFPRGDGTNWVTSTQTIPNTSAAGTILNNASANTASFTVTPTIGVAGASTGTLSLAGVTSGTITIQPQSAAGTYNFNLPTTAGSSGQVLTSAGGLSAAMTWTSPLTNPMTTAGDMIVSSDGSGTATRGMVPSSSIINCSLTATVASSALTVALKDGAGSDPGASSPCMIGFRNATAATGTTAIVQATAATSVVISNGSSLGCTASSACNLNVYAINNAGTVELGVIYGLLDEGSVQSSTTEGGAGAADTIATLYSTTGRASKAVRLLGRVTITPAASFAWTNAATEISLPPFPTPTITSWTAFTPTGAWSTNTTYTGFWRRVGDTECEQVKVATSGAPTSATLTINVRSGVTIDTAKMVGSTAAVSPIIGSNATANDTGNATYLLGVFYSSTTAVRINKDDGDGTIDTAVTQAAPFTFGAGDSVEASYCFPVVGW